MTPSTPEMSRPSRESVQRLARKFASVRVCVLGDVMLDRYFWGDADRISPEAPVPVVRVTRRSARLGGAANVAANLGNLGASVRISGLTGEDREGSELRELAGTMGIDTGGLVAVPGRETTEKVRIIARNQQVVRADFESDGGADEDAVERLFDDVRARIDESDALVISDYGKGAINERLLRDLIALWREAGKLVLVDPHVPHFAWYRGASVITPNTREATRATGIPFDRDGSVSAPVFELLASMELDALLVTRGEHGMSLYYGENREVHIPTVAKEVYDVTGAGDTVISVLALALAAGADLESAVVIANAAAGEVVKEVGTTTLRPDALVAAFSV